MYILLQLIIIPRGTLMSLYILDVVFYHLRCVSSCFYGLSDWDGCCPVVSIGMIIYNILNVYPNDYRTVGRLSS